MVEEREISGDAFRILLTGIEDMIGRNGLNTMLRQANLAQFVNSTASNDGNHSNVPIAQGAHLHRILLDLYGRRQARMVMYQSGRSQVRTILQEHAKLFATIQLAMRVLSTQRKIRQVLEEGAKNMNQSIGAQAVVGEENGQVYLDVSHCYQCLEVHSEFSICYATAGIIDAFLEWATSSKSYKTEEILCSAKGDPVCRYVVREIAGDGHARS